jgi:hypothetical protein
VSLQLLHPELAHERASDFGPVFSSQAQGEPPRNGFHIPSRKPPVEDRVKREHWLAHYYGRPARQRERDLAFVRLAAYADDETARAYIARLVQEMGR